MAVPLKVSKAAEVSEVPERGPGFYDFSVSEYDRMIESGILTKDDRVELLEGRVVDLVDRVVEVHRKPQNGRYGSHDTFGAGDTVSCEAFPDLGISVDGIVGESSTPP